MPAFQRSVDVLEVAYRLDLPDREWLQSLLVATQEARPHRDLGAMGAAFLYESQPTGEDFRAWGYAQADSPEDALHALQGFHASLTPEDVQRLYWQVPALCATGSQLKLPASPEQQELGVKDLFGLQATDASGVGCCLLFALPEEIALRPSVRRHWSAVAYHMRAALRLRTALASDDVWDRVEAVIDPSRSNGRLVHAGGLARDRDARQTLQRIARSIDQARSGSKRLDGDAVLRAWPELIKGHWTLIEQFDSGGKRYYVALRNEPEAAARVRLNRRERGVIEGVVNGSSNKFIAESLDIKEPAVNSYLRRAMAKLRVRTRNELIALAGSDRGAPVTVGSNELLVLRTGGGDMRQHLEQLGLTRAEIEVAEGIQRGESNEVIANNRGSKMRTVANQVQSIFRKLRVNSRAELVALLAKID